MLVVDPNSGFNTDINDSFGSVIKEGDDSQVVILDAHQSGLGKDIVVKFHKSSLVESMQILRLKNLLQPRGVYYSGVQELRGEDISFTIQEKTIPILEILSEEFIDLKNFSSKEKAQAQLTEFVSQFAEEITGIFIEGLKAGYILDCDPCNIGYQDFESQRRHNWHLSLYDFGSYRKIDGSPINFVKKYLLTDFVDLEQALYSKNLQNGSLMQGDIFQIFNKIIFDIALLHFYKFEGKNSIFDANFPKEENNKLFTQIFNRIRTRLQEFVDSNQNPIEARITKYGFLESKQLTQGQAKNIFWKAAIALYSEILFRD
jgi:hypothetical protein